MISAACTGYSNNEQFWWEKNYLDVWKQEELHGMVWFRERIVGITSVAKGG
jgi:hypothetical protein